MNQYFPTLFSPASIGRLQIKNRIIMPAMGSNFASATGEITDAQIAYYEERARGGAGLIIVENSNVDYARGQSPVTHVRIDDDLYIPSLHALVEAVHRYGARIGIQLNHVGGGAKRTTGGPFAPSAIAMMPGAPVPAELSREDIADIIRKFGLAAQRAKRAGFDIVEVHGAHLYLIAQFLSPVTNQRNDEYGGSLEGRLKFGLDVVREVRKAVGDSFPIIFRHNAESFMPGSVTAAEAVPIARAMEKASVDALSISCGGPAGLGESETMASIVEPMSYAQGWKTHYAAEIKKAVSAPIITVGVIREPQFAEKILKENQADFVAIGRGLIADPEWPQKAAAGNSDMIRKCISCNEGCYLDRLRGWRLHCAINAAAGRERELNGLVEAEQPRRIGVIGGGPAGMEFARIAACRGHHVTLYEKEKETGGQLIPGSVPPGKEKIRWLIDYLNHEIELSRIEVYTGKAVSVPEIIARKYDVVVVATGAEPIAPPRLTGRNVVTAVDVLSGRVDTGRGDIVIIGGGSVGCETATYLAKNDRKVTICEMLDRVATDLDPNSRWDLLDRMAKSGVAIRTKTQALEIRNDGVLVSDGREELISGGLVVLALGMKPVNQMAAELEGKVAELHIIGDARQTGRIIEAIYAGNILGRTI